MRTLNVFIVSLLFMQLCACTKTRSELMSNSNKIVKTDTMKLKISIGSKVFIATLVDNETTKAFKSKLPMTINMVELNSNEKYFDFADGLPSNSSNPGTIQKGDLMLFGSKSLVLFYKSFSTSYSYTKLGRIEDTSELSETLGTGNITVKFELN